MKRTLPTTALALLLLAGVSGAALAQDRDRGDRNERPAAQPQAAHPAVAPAGQPGVRQQAVPQIVPQRAPGDRFSPQAHGVQGPGAPGRAPQGGPRPAIQPPGPGAVPPQRYQGPAPGSVPRQNFERDRGRGPVSGAPDGGPRQFERDRGPQTVIPPGADRGRDFRPDNRADGRDGRGGGDRHWDSRDHRWDNRGEQERWRPGRYPPVFWSHDRYRISPYRAPYGYYVRSWAFGDFLPRTWFGESYWIDDFYAYGLPYPPPGYEWVRVGPDALMVDRYTGRIVQVVRGIFW